MKKLNITLKHEKDYIISLVLVFLSVIFWGLSFISTKIVLNEIPPVTIAFFRQIIATAPLLLGLFISKSCFKITLKDLLLLTVSSFFGITLYFLFENKGLVHTTASNASIIVATVPVFTLVTEVLLYKLKINRKIISYIFLSIAGVYLVISSNGKLDFSSSTMLGNILVMGAMVSWIVYTIVSRKLGQKYSSLLITTYQAAISIFLFIPFIVPEIPKWKAISTHSLINLVYLGVCCSALAYFFFLYGIKKLGATVSSVYLNMIPVVTVIAGFFILDEKLTIIQLSGMSLVIISLYKLSRK